MAARLPSVPMDMGRAGRTLKDSICGNGERFMAAVKCANGVTYLHCAPNNLKDRSTFCQAPNAAWMQAKCKLLGGSPQLMQQQSGCYKQDPMFWTSWLGITVTSEDFCSFFPVALPAAPANMGFELGDFTGWIVQGNTGSVTIEGCPDNCYARLGTSGTGPSTQPNSVSRNDLIIANGGGCNGDRDHQLQFRMRFDNGDVGGSFNDYVTVIAQQQDGTTVGLKTYDSNGGSKDWTTETIPLGQVPAGSFLRLTITGAVSNGGDSIAQSTGYVDDFQLL